ncbi:MAG: hypothetical protein IPG32_21540 [Saprospirales bacterium]|nr:hypothetical protein [Saprospirales bacterium]
MPLSSDIWISNLINTFENKKIRYYLQTQKLDKYRNEADRKEAYLRLQAAVCQRQLPNGRIPGTPTELTIMISPLKHFIIHRILLPGADNSTIIPEITAFIANKDFHNHTGHLQILSLYVHYFDLEGADRDIVEEALQKVRKSMPGFNHHWFEFLLEMEKLGLDLNPDADVRALTALDLKVKDGLSDYYKMLDILHDEGFRSEKAQEAVRVFYSKHEGMSIESECIRQTVYLYFERAIRPMDVSDYLEFFEIAKPFTIYMGIFASQQFNQRIKDLSMAFVHKCMDKFTDKRGKDYQDVKKFVATSFKDWGFLREKEIQEMFKTKRTRKKGT